MRGGGAACAALLGAPAGCLAGWEEDMERVMAAREAMVERARDSISAAIGDSGAHAGCDLPGMCSYLDIQGLIPNADFAGTPTADAVGFGPRWAALSAAQRSEMCAVGSLAPQYRQNLADSEGTKWQYYGSQEHGFIGNYPNFQQTETWCAPSAQGGYDSRYRPWYAAAAGGPKDIVLVLDTSESMCLSAASTSSVADIEQRVQAAGGSVDGELVISLSWDTSNDLDLHVLPAGGTEIYFQNPCRAQQCPPGSGTLDVDMYDCPQTQTQQNEGSAQCAKGYEPVENVVFPVAPSSVKIMVNLYAQRTAPIPFTVQMKSFGCRQQFNGSFGVSQEKTHHMVFDGTISASDAPDSRSRMGVMKRAAKALVASLSFLDFVQVVQFNDRVDSQGVRLLRGTQENKVALWRYIDGMQASGGTDFNLGFKKAFEILKASGGSGCRRVISFLTDGHAADPSGNVTAWNAELEAACGTRATVFAYSLGSGADRAVPQSLACSTGGVFYPIPDNDEMCLKNAMVKYYEFFANGIADQQKASPRWSEIYCDGFGMGEVASVGIPVFGQVAGVGGQPRLLGVAAVDVQRSEFSAGGDDPLESIESVLLRRSQSCLASCLTAEGWRATQLAALGACGGAAATEEDLSCAPPAGTLCPTGRNTCQDEGSIQRHTLSCRVSMLEGTAASAGASVGNPPLLLVAGSAALLVAYAQ